MKIVYSKEAVVDLERLREFIARHDPAAASRYARKLLDGVSNLQAQPLLGHVVPPAPDPEHIRDLIIGDYIVRYAILAADILILRIWHHREDWK